MPNSVGEIIKKLRIERGLTQKQLGELCEMADSAIRRYENGRANPKIETLQKIANALNVNVSELRNDFQIFKDNIVDESGILSSAKKADVLQNDLWAEFQKRKIIEKLDITPDKQELLFEYNKLNKIGRNEAVKRVKDLTFNPEYRKDNE
ncbi:dNA-binding helix-turn-helix protein [Blautia hydrogenotrophica CAG:147]|uniref:helix-turn-helix domain-containing protein n=1 Tax=Blautia hydrogenotrophica TaxID=53443 RepID=UPI000334FC77|nr:helix-turn-helix transcriptional regulator [Blautia hydrogenotrophica]CCX58195.1 dNA-binding helix-turn-helix protein [Blautia hydrogenotrophica CAG:147]CUM90383.1 anaerobic benzoate catabolism transcriptional regulator [Blautia hydrogenotrophica]SCH54578.1 anaerobic benzoate catabolism transcriptional regulator [uncultured Blautia sp.]DAH91706.1 MAG TPA: helix-turn-helix domain protein [Bacteriophage sp.]